MDTAFVVSFAPFSLCILQGNLDVLQYDGHMLGMYGVEMMQYQFLLCFPLSFFTTDSAGVTHYHIVVFHFLLYHLLPCLIACPFFINLISCFSHLGLCSDKFMILRVFNFQTAPVFHSLVLLLLTHFIHIHCIFLSLPAASISSSVSSLS